MVHRDTDTDLIRVIACFLVVGIHCCYPMTALNQFYRSLMVLSVPLFAMISGHYMLQRKRPVKESLCRGGRFFCVMLCWAMLYFLYELAVLHTRSYTGLLPLLKYLLTEPNHLWYLYAAITLCLFAPPLSVFSAHASRSEYRYALELTFALGSVIFILVRSGAFPFLETVVERMKISYMCGFLFCYLFGGYYQKFGIKEKGLVYFAGILGSVVTAMGVLMLPDQYIELTVSFFAPGVLLSAVAFYTFWRTFCLKHPFQNRFLSGLADCSMGIYLLHPAAILFLQEIVGDSLTAFYVVPLRTAGIFAICACAVFLCRKIPLLKRLF